MKVLEPINSNKIFIFTQIQKKHSQTTHTSSGSEREKGFNTHKVFWNKIDLEYTYKMLLIENEFLTLSEYISL